MDHDSNNPSHNNSETDPDKDSARVNKNDMRDSETSEKLDPKLISNLVTEINEETENNEPEIAIHTNSIPSVSPLINDNFSNKISIKLDEENDQEPKHDNSDLQNMQLNTANDNPTNVLLPKFEEPITKNLDAQPQDSQNAEPVEQFILNQNSQNISQENNEIPSTEVNSQNTSTDLSENKQQHTTNEVDELNLKNIIDNSKIIQNEDIKVVDNQSSDDKESSRSSQSSSSSSSKNSKSSLSKRSEGRNNALPALFMPSSKEKTNENSTFLTSLNLGQSIRPNKELVKDAYERFIKYGELPSPDLRDGVIQYINHKKVDALCESDYDQAEMCDEQMMEFTKLINQENCARSNEDRARIVEFRLNRLNEERMELERQWNHKIERQQQANQRRIEKLEEKHEKELEDFREKWKSNDYLKQFNKSSPKLLQLRYQEKQLAISRRYTDAKEVKRIADKLQIEEEKQMQIAIEKKISIEFSKLNEKQQKEIESANDHNDKIITQLQLQKIKDLKPYEQQLKSKNQKKAASATKFGSSYYSISPMAAISTPRTLSRFAKYKTSKCSNLNVKSLDNDQINKMSTDNWSPSQSNPRKTSHSVTRKISSPNKYY